MERSYFLFRSTHETLKAESVLLAASLTAKAVMKPAAIRSDCGLALRVARSDRDQAIAHLAIGGITVRSEHIL